MGEVKFIALNEINLDLAKKYVKRSPGLLPNFEKILTGKIIETKVEDDYHYLEPWIVWPSVFLGKGADSHNIFHLGDGARVESKSIFAVIESLGFKVGAISPINAPNDLTSPAFFIPDPWIETDSDRSMMSRIITNVTRSAVNSNASNRLSLKDILGLGLILLRFARLKNYAMYVKYALRARRKKWYRSLFFDLLMFDIYTKLAAKKEPDLSFLFLNAGAHIQHHHMFSSIFSDESCRDPQSSKHYDAIADMLAGYDRLLGQCFAQHYQSLVIATGLTQIPYDREKYYYRPRDHEAFLKTLGVRFERVFPRMSRDFEISFSDAEEMMHAEETLKLASIGTEEYPVFRVVRIDALRIFVTLVYARQIQPDDLIKTESAAFLVSDAVDLVAQKNGMHSGKGWAFFDGDIGDFCPPSESHPKELFLSVKSIFEAATCRSVE